MDYSFNLTVAQTYGVEEAVFLHNMYFWLVKNAANKKHVYDGRVWTYNSQKALLKLFPFWTQKQMRSVIDRLKRCGAIIVGNFNKTPLDRTLWYTLSDEVLKIYTENGGLDIKIDDVSSEKNDDKVSVSGDKIEQSSASSKPVVSEQNTPKMPENAHLPKRANANVQTGECICPNGQMQAPERANVPDIKPNINTNKKPINQSVSLSSDCNTYNNSNIYPLPLEDRRTDIRGESEDREGMEVSEEAKFYVECIKDRVKESDKLCDVGDRVVRLSEDLLRCKSVKINGVSVSVENVLNNLINLFGCEEDNRVLEAYAIIDEKIARGEVHNKFNYIVSTLYNAARI